MKFRVAIIGLGGITNMHMRGYLAMPNDVEVVAGADISDEKKKKFKDTYKIENLYSDYKKMLKEVKPDLASVCTPNYAHMKPTIDALSSGAHVICEKPMAMNSIEAEKMLDASKKAKKILTIAHQMRFNSQSQVLKSYIDRGDIGEIYYGRSWSLRRIGIPGWGVFHIKEKSCGGPMIDIGVHALDCITWLMGNPEPVSVTGMTYAKFGKSKDFPVTVWGDYNRDEFDVEDFACGFVRFANGATLSIESSWAANIETDSMQQTLMGTKGGASTMPLRIFKMEKDHFSDIHPKNLPEADPYVMEIKRFVEACQGKCDILVKPEQCLKTQKIIDAVYESAKSGKEVILKKKK